MPTTQPVSRDPALEAHALWYNFRREIAAAIVLAILAIIAWGGYKLYSDRREGDAATMLATARNAQDYEQVIARYPGTSAGASACLLLAEAQRKDRKFVESNATLQAFIDKNPTHELVSTAEMGVAVNLEAMGKTDEALSGYQRVAAKYPDSFSAPLALISQVPLLKAKKQDDAARRVCETIINQYGRSFWAMQAMQELRSLKPSGLPQGPGTLPVRPGGPPAGPQPPMMLQRPPIPAATPPKPK